MVDNDLDTDVHGAPPTASGALADRPGSSDGSRPPPKHVRSPPYPTKDSSAAASDSNAPRAASSQDAQERLASSMVEQVKRLMRHLEGRLQTDRAQIQQEQGL